MQVSAARIADLSDETAETVTLYGADDATNSVKARFARNCILARRLEEKGVRFVQRFNGAYAMGEGVGNRDGHETIVKQYDVHGPILDQPVAGLLRDLEHRGCCRPATADGRAAASRRHARRRGKAARAMGGNRVRDEVSRRPADPA